jgi:CAAX prenyl protease-like protein
MASLLSHALPYALYLAPGAVAELLPDDARPWATPCSVLLSAAALSWFGARGAYAELRTSVAPRGSTALALGAGLGVALLWLPLTALVPRLGTPVPFDPAAAGAGAVPWLVAARVLGFVAVIPLAEELLVRSLLPRYVDTAEGWTARGIGEFTRLSAGVSIVFFTLTHSEWLAALVTGVLWTLLLARTRRLRDAVLAHAVANGLLALSWLHPGARDGW